VKALVVNTGRSALDTRAQPRLSLFSPRWIDATKLTCHIGRPVIARWFFMTYSLLLQLPISMVKVTSRMWRFNYALVGMGTTGECDLSNFGMHPAGFCDELRQVWSRKTGWIFRCLPHRKRSRYDVSPEFSTAGRSSNW
jgi:hypothetical protein